MATSKKSGEPSNWLTKASKNINAVDIVNVAMAANTLSANTRAAQAQKRAALAGIIQLPFMPKQHIPISTPMSLAAEKQAGNIRTQARNIASSTSDINKSFGVLLAGEKQAADILGKGQAADIQTNEKLKAMQRESDFKTAAYNLEVLGKNKASVANAIKSINLVDANKEIAQNTARNNLLIGLEKNLRVKENRKRWEELVNLQNDPEYNANVKRLAELSSPEEIQRRKDAFEKSKDKLTASKGEEKVWEKSEDYNQYKNDIKAIADIIQTHRDKYNSLYSAFQFSNLYRSGGSLSKQDRIELEREKASLRSAQKDKDLSYKMILQNNELLVKSLIKIFK